MSKHGYFTVTILLILAAGSLYGGTLFPAETPGGQWSQFSAAGFEKPVAGVIYRTGAAPCCGVPMGGVDTGCLDIDTRGVYGFSTIFNPKMQFRHVDWWIMPRTLPTNQPILGLCVGGKTWVLAAKQYIDGGDIQICTEPYCFDEYAGKKVTPLTVPCPKIEGVQPAKEIHYWGHFPVADMEFETDGPVSVGLRSWSPFLPGDSAASNTPAAVFEVHLRNDSAKLQQGTIAFNFPGTDGKLDSTPRCARTRIDEDFHGVVVGSGGNQYALGVIGDEKLRTGAGLMKSPDAWSKIATELPEPAEFPGDGPKTYSDISSSAAVDFSIAPGQEKVVRFLLAWYAPVWEGGHNNLAGHPDEAAAIKWIASKWAGNTNYYTHMYAARYGNVIDVTRRMAVEHGTLLKRVLAWQDVIYGDQKLPVWLRDSLVNNLCLITEDSYWAQAKPPLGDWAHPEGAFGMCESPRGCPQIECIPCDWYGNLPIVYLFPDLAKSTLRIFKHYQRDDGAICFALGKGGDLPDFATMSYAWQRSLNSTCYLDMVDRLWQRTGDNNVLKEFYDSAKKANTYTMNLRQGPGGVISFPKDGGMEWFEHGDWAGMAPHMGGLHLAQLRMVERMAEKMGDKDYAAQCKTWYADGTKAMESEMWNGTYYLNYWDKETGKKSDDIMGYQLDGEWAARYHGLDGVFRPDRVKTTLETIKKCNIALTPNCGAANFTQKDGSALSSHAVGKEQNVTYYGTHAMFTAEVLVLAMTYMDAGQRDFGLNFAKTFWEDLVIKQRHPWDMPNMVRGDTGQRIFGTDYYQAMMLWALPAEVHGQDIGAFSATGGLVDRIISAAK